MNLFRTREVTAPDVLQRLSTLETELRNLQSEFRSLQAETATVHSQVHKWMKRAIAAESRHQERAGGAAPSPVTPVAPPGTARLWGARARRAARLTVLPDEVAEEHQTPVAETGGS